MLHLLIAEIEQRKSESAYTILQAVGKRERVVAIDLTSETRLTVQR